MSTDSISQSSWRIDLARELAVSYSEHPEVVFAVLGGSPGKGLSDAYSDLDMVIYWNSMDMECIDAVPLALPRIDLMKSSPGICLESYSLDGLKVDVGHVDMETWTAMVDQVLLELDTDGGLQKSLQGFLHSVVLYGEDRAGDWKERVGAYPPALGEKMVKENLRFFVRGYLLNQCWRRGDELAFRDGICAMLKNILGVLAGINRIYLSTDEPRWLAWELGRMDIRPADIGERMERVLSEVPEDAVATLDQLILDVFALVREHMPSVDVAYRTERYMRQVLPCSSPPALGAAPPVRRDS